MRNQQFYVSGKRPMYLVLHIRVSTVIPQVSGMNDNRDKKFWYITNSMKSCVKLAFSFLSNHSVSPNLQISCKYGKDILILSTAYISYCGSLFSFDGQWYIDESLQKSTAMNKIYIFQHIIHLDLTIFLFTKLDTFGLLSTPSVFWCVVAMWRWFVTYCHYS